MPQILNKETGPIGFGLMSLTWKANLPTEEESFAAMRTAVENGSLCWNGGEFYGPTEANSLVLLRKYFEKYPEDASKVILNIKGGVNPATYLTDASPQNTRRTLDDSIAQLGDCKKIDMFEFGRRDPKFSLEETFGLIEREYIQTGKIGGIALCEVRAETIHEAVKYTKVLAVEAELSLFTTDILTNGVAAACAQYDIPIIAYSPIGRGMLTGTMKKYEDVPADSLLKQFNFPRFHKENFEKNVELVEKIETMAKAKGCTPAQLALNWTVALSRRPGMPTIIPIPGASSAARVEENSTLVEITDEEMLQIDDILARFTTAGKRWPDSVPSET